MNPASIACPFCGLAGRRILLPEDEHKVIYRTCSCRKGASVEYVRFPALDRKEEIPEAAPLQLEDDASCFHHPDRKAVAVCKECGIFICELCEVKISETESLCLTCFSRQQTVSQQKDSKANPRDGHILWDRVALAAAILPIPTFYFTALTAPYTLYVVIRRWKGHPYSVLGGSRAMFVFAFLIALAQIAGIVFFILAMTTAFASL